MLFVYGVFRKQMIKKQVALEGIARLRAFFKSIGLPVTFRELGIEHPDIDRLGDSLHRNKGELVGNYVKLTKEDSKEIYRLDFVRKNTNIRTAPLHIS